MTDLAELLERVKAATGPDRQLDLALAQALGLPWSYIGEPPRGIECPRVTASLDAALALVERVLPGWNGVVSFGGDGEQRADLWGPVKEIGTSFDWEPVEIRDNAGGEHKLPAIALLAALLSALIAQPASDDVGSATLTRDA